MVLNKTNRHESYCLQNWCPYKLPIMIFLWCTIMIFLKWLDQNIYKSKIDLAIKKKQLFPLLTACSTNKQTKKKHNKNFTFWQQKKKKRNPKNKAELPWKLWIAACVLQAWWLKLHSAATSYHLPRLLKVCATYVPDLCSTRSQQCASDSLRLRKWDFQKTHRGFHTGRLCQLRPSRGVHMPHRLWCSTSTHLSHLTFWLFFFILKLHLA